MKKKPLLSDDERLAINREVAEAERKTSAEILPAVAASSGRYDRAEDVFGLFVGLGLVGVAWALFQGVGAESGWSATPRVTLGFWLVAALVVVGFVVGAIVAGRVFGLRRLFTSNLEMDQETVAGAKTVFFDNRLHRTSDACGVLLYVSVYERRSAILADDRIHEQLSERGLEEVQEELLAGIKEDGLAAGIRRGVRRLGELLEVALPATSEDRNEVFNEVIVLD